MTTTNTPAFSPVRIGQVEFVNLTPHAIVFRDEQGVDWTIPPSGQVARIGSESFPSISDERTLGLFVRVDPTHSTGWEDYTNWAITEEQAAPDQRRVAIVSSLFLDALRREWPSIDSQITMWLVHHMVSPLTDGTAIRNDKGHIVAVRGFRTELLPWEFRKIGLSPD